MVQKFHESLQISIEVNFLVKNFVITLNFRDSMLPHPFSASALYPWLTFKLFCEQNFRDLEVNHEIHESIVPWKFGAMR